MPPEIAPEEVAEWISARARQGKAKSFSGVAIDSRKLKKGELFFAIHGEKQDGHRFVSEAIKRGSAGVVVSKKVSVPDSIWLFIVPETKKALGKLATGYFKKKETKAVAITGSTGKSTTKELIYCLLATQYPTLRSQASYNNEIGVPLTALTVKQEKYLVQEMAMRKPGDIRYLCQIVPPFYGVITCVGTAHVGITGSIEQTIKGKGELLKCLPENGIAFLNADDPNSQFFSAHRVKKFGFSGGEFRFQSPVIIPEKGWQVDFYRKKKKLGRLTVPLLGRAMLHNALAALSVACMLGITAENLQKGLLDYKPLPGRLELIQGKNTILYDAYNANLESSRQAVWTLAYHVRARKKIAVLGSMLELGRESASCHYQLGAYCGALPIDKLYAVGEFAEFTLEGFRTTAPKKESCLFSSNREVIRKLRRELAQGDAVLLKASRALCFEEILEAFQ